MTGLDWAGQQQDFSAGAFPLSERIPLSAVEDCTGGLTDDDGSLFRRGGGVYKGTANALQILSLFDVQLAAGQRTVMLSASALYQLGADDSTPALVRTFPGSPTTAASVSRAAIVGGILAVPYFNPALTPVQAFVQLFAGSRASAIYTTGTLAATKGSKVVTGTGTLWAGAGLDRGTIVYAAPSGGTGNMGVVDTVDSDTQITLMAPWPGATATGLLTTLGPHISTTATVVQRGIQNNYVASVANRLVHAAGNIIAFTAPLDPFVFAATDYHVIPSGQVTGLQPLRNDLLVFSTTGIYRIANMAYDLTDASGNIQQALSPVAHDVILWGDPGIAGIDGGVIVPAVDDLYTVSSAGAQKFNAPGMRKQWRAYVKAGYTLGNAAVHRGRYFLPILDSTGRTFEDLLVLRLDTGAWTRWSGHSAGVSFAQRGATTTTPPKLLAAQGTRIVDNTGCFEPAVGNKLDADGSTPPFQVTLRTVQRHTAKDLLRRFKARVELDDAASDSPTLTAEAATGRPGSAFTTLSGSMAAGDGQTAQKWEVNRRGQEFRVRLTAVGPSANLRVRSVEYGFRSSGQQ